VTRSTADPAAPDTYLLNLAGELWPAPAEVSQHRGRAVGQVISEFVYVPNAAAPKVLVPAGSRRAAAGAVRRYSDLTSIPALIRTEALRLALRTGLGQAVMRDRLRVTSSPADGAATIQGFLEECLGERVFLSLSVGPVRANRKPILGVLRSDGHMLAYVKVGLNEVTKTLVRRESEVLRGLPRGPDSCVRVPDVLHHGLWNGLEVLVLGALPAGPRWPRDRAVVATAMKEIAERPGVSTQRLGESRYVSSLAATLDGMDSPTADRLATALTSLRRGWNELEVRFGSWHGDWTPWNMSANGNHVNVWDWERYTHGVPLGFDALHYQLHASRSRLSPEAAVAQLRPAAAAALDPFGVAPEAVTAVLSCYALDVAIRYLTDVALLTDTTWQLPPSPLLRPFVELIEACAR
jgi:hypothetical protein